MILNKRTIMIMIILLVTIILFGCDQPPRSGLNNRMKNNNSSSSPTPQIDLNQKEALTPAANQKSKEFGEPDESGRVGYYKDIEKDVKNYDGHVDITVGDKLYSTQINDWYTNFKQYEGKIVEIEGYYIADYEPYTFVGRYGPSCPYCNGGYVSFEFYTKEDLSKLTSGKDWIRVTGKLRRGEDSSGVYYYIEVLKLKKMDKVGKDTVTN